MTKWKPFLKSRALAAQRLSLQRLISLWRDEHGAVFVEYLLLVTIVGIGLIAGLAVVRHALFTELQELANAISAITT